MFECTSEGVIGLGDLPEPFGSVIKFCTMMSKKCKYALKALSCLAKFEGKKLNSVQIADQEKIPRKFLENILLTLKLQGYISSNKGIDCYIRRSKV